MKTKMEDDSGSTTWLLPVLRRIRIRPGMYLRDDRLNSLACYIDGIVYGLERANVLNTPDASFLHAFGEWLGARFDCRNGDCWFYLMMCMPGRTGHVDDFYGSIDEFLRESGFALGLDDPAIELIAWPKRDGCGSFGSAES
jgi:hypothetical protein